MGGQGFNPTNWKAVKVWEQGCAMPHDVDAAAAVFALGDTLNGKPLGWTLPQPEAWPENQR